MILMVFIIQNYQCWVILDKFIKLEKIPVLKNYNIRIKKS